MAAAALLSELAKNTKIAFDANKGVDQLSTLMRTGAIDGAVVLNMDKNVLGHKLFMMPDVLNMNHTVYHENFCAFNAACHIFKTKLLGASGKIKVCIDSAWGAGEYKDRTYVVDEGYLYTWDGEGFNVKGTVSKWKAGLTNKRRLMKTIRRLQTPTNNAFAAT
jgi:hypothetical protein